MREPAIKMNKDPFVHEKEEKKIGLFPPFPSSLAMKKSELPFSLQLL